MMETTPRSISTQQTEGDALAAFLQYLRTDKRFYYTDDEMLRDYSHGETMDAALPKLFGKLRSALRHQTDARTSPSALPRPTITRVPLKTACRAPLSSTRAV